MAAEWVKIKRVMQNPWQTRALDPEHAKGLAADIDRNGMLQPPVGRYLKGGDLLTIADAYQAGTADRCLVQLAFGHHRLAAAKLLGWEDIRVEIRDLTDEQMAVMAWSENEGRRDVEPVQKAMAFQRYMQDFGWTQEQMAERLGVDRSTVANDLRLLKLPDDVKKALAKGEISKRQAMALLPVFDLPASAVAKAEATDWNGAKPSQLVKDAVNGKLSSDDLRERVTTVINQATVDLTGIAFLEAVFEGEGYVSPTCEGCRARVARKSGSRCGNPECFGKKKAAWTERSLAGAAAKLGLGLMPENVPFHERDEFYDPGIAKHLLETGCENLRITPGDPSRPDHWGNYEGLGVRLCCHHPGTGTCACLEKIRGKANQAKAEQAAAARQKLNDEIAHPAAMALAKALDAGARSEEVSLAWMVVLGAIDRGATQKDGNARWVWERIAAALVKEVLPWSAESNQEHARERVEDLLEQAGVQPPWQEDAQSAVEELRVKLARVEKWIETLVHQVPSAAALAGNIDNLDRLLSAAIALNADELSRAISYRLDSLKEVQRALEVWDGEEIEEMAGIWHTSQTYAAQADVPHMSLGAAKYLLALAEGVPPKANGEGKKTLRVALRKRLAELESPGAMEKAAEIEE